MSKIMTSLVLGAALIATAGCTKRTPPGLIPPGDQGPVNGGGNDGSGIRPGSAEDFRRSVLTDTVNFDLDQYDIDPEARRILDSQAAWLNQYPNVSITIEGHCDERGTREYNLALGDRRANAAKNYLAARGISPNRITTISYGKERPIALGSDDTSWRQNRRAVTIVIN